MFDEKQNQKDICRALAWQHGDKDAAEALLKQYQPLIRSIRRSFCQCLSYEDLEQELILHFFRTDRLLRPEEESELCRLHHAPSQVAADEPHPKGNDT